MVSRLELKASRSVILGDGIILLFTLPWITSPIEAQICTANEIRQNMSEQETSEPLVGLCNRYHWATTYTRLMLLIAHSFYQSILYVI